jgi:2-polyprenyl-6-methoxyphenol hydroxylase-like FAD-dependent oxidoreductase
MVARAVGAAAYHERPVLSMGCYTYLAGVPLTAGEIYGRPGRAVGAWPTNDGLTLIFVAWPVAEFGTFRADPEANFQKTLDLAGDLGERVRAGQRAERFRTTPDLPNRFRVPYGPGWALVGDAGLVMDPITGQGVGHALRDAELLAEAVTEGLGGTRPLDEALRGYQQTRDRLTKPMYDFSTQLASFAPTPPEAEALFAALAGRPAETTRFLGMMTGTVAMEKYFRPGNLIRVIGPAGMLRLAVRKARRR